ncbi:RNA polymerase ECF-type sigma factor [Filimonas lacunae]|nr:RNA polymerase ECF-type sigma factor [Filimonas lacunae]
MAVSYLPDAVAAQDMVQEVFARVWLHRQKLHGILNIEAWIIAISRNLLMNELRKAYPLDVAGHVAINSTQDTLNYRELEKLLAIAITMLSSRQQEIYRLSRQEGYSHKQIAERLGISVDMSREHLSKALKNIRIFLAGKYSQVSIAS